MGYSKTINIGDSFDFPCTYIYPSQSIAAAVTDVSLPGVTLPSFIGRIQHAYLGLHVGRIDNTSGAANNRVAAPFYVQIALSVGGTYTNAIFINSDCFWCPDTIVYPGCTIVGSIDIKDQCRAGAASNVKMNDCSSTGSNLILRDTYTFLRVMLE